MRDNSMYAGVPDAAFELLIFVLTTTKAYKMCKAQRVLHGERKTLSRVMLEDGCIFFLDHGSRQPY